MYQISFIKSSLATISQLLSIRFFIKSNSFFVKFIFSQDFVNSNFFSFNENSHKSKVFFLTFVSVSSFLSLEALLKVELILASKTLGEKGFAI